MQQSLTLGPISQVGGTVHLPGSKSLSHRVLLLAAMAHGKTYIAQWLNSDDVSYLLHVLSQLGINYHCIPNDALCEVHGLGGPLQCVRPMMTPPTLFLGNAGAALRPLTALLSLGHSEVILTGDARMQQRPIGPLVDALRQGKAEIDYLGCVGYPPLRLRGGFQGGELSVSGHLSSQFLSALLMAAPLAPNNSQIVVTGELVSQPYVEMTLQLMRRFGIIVTHHNYQRFSILGGQHYVSPGYLQIEGDATSASYFLAAAAIKGGTVRVIGLGPESLQGEVQFVNCLQRMGAHIEWGSNYIACTRGRLCGIEGDFNHMPDSAMTLAALALFASGPTTLHNLYHWRFKESDRLRAMATELRKVGATVVEEDDALHIIPPRVFQKATLNTYDDHRLAMCFSLLALSNRAITIEQPHCVSKSFPDFFTHFAHITAQ